MFRQDDVHGAVEIHGGKDDQVAGRERRAERGEVSEQRLSAALLAWRGGGLLQTAASPGGGCVAAIAICIAIGHCSSAFNFVQTTHGPVLTFDCILPEL